MAQICWCGWTPIWLDIFVYMVGHAPIQHKTWHQQLAQDRFNYGSIPHKHTHIHFPKFKIIIHFVHVDFALFIVSSCCCVAWLFPVSCCCYSRSLSYAFYWLCRFGSPLFCKHVCEYLFIAQNRVYCLLEVVLIFPWNVPEVSGFSRSRLV